MQSDLLSEGPERTYTVVFDPGEEAVDGLRAQALKEEVGAASLSFTAIGGFTL